MASQPRTREREEERHLSILTLVIASIASATAAIITSYFWKAGTPIAAAVTPVIVALISEMLHRPTKAVARRMTTDRPAILSKPDEPRGEVPPEEESPRPEEPPSPAEPPVRVYGRTPRRKRKIAVGVVVTTAVLAFAIAAAALTLPELVTGDSIGKGERDTTLFGGRDRDRNGEQQEPAETAPAATEQEPQPDQSREKDQPRGVTPPQETEQTETETTPRETETAPKAQPR